MDPAMNATTPAQAKQNPRQWSKKDKNPDLADVQKVIPRDMSTWAVKGHKQKRKFKSDVSR